VLHRHGRIDAFRLVLHGLQLDEGVAFIRPEHLARLRPLNDVSYGPAAQELADDTRAGRIQRHANPRRLAFSASLAAFGLLSMKAMVERLHDPLGSSDEALVRSVRLGPHRSARHQARRHARRDALGRLLRDVR
jgi:hypothetical protein